MCSTSLSALPSNVCTAPHLHCFFICHTEPSDCCSICFCIQSASSQLRTLRWMMRFWLILRNALFIIQRLILTPIFSQFGNSVHAEESVIRPLPRTWMRRCPRLARIKVIDGGDWVCSSYQAHSRLRHHQDSNSRSWQQAEHFSVAPWHPRTFRNTHACCKCTT